MFKKLLMGLVGGFYDDTPTPRDTRFSATNQPRNRYKERGRDGKFGTGPRPGVYAPIPYTGGGYVSTMPYKFGRVYGTLKAGPFKAAPPGTFKISMAQENCDGANFVIPTVDFGVPNPETFKAGLLLALAAMAMGKTVYVGCGWGQGRTGTFLMALAKIMALNGDLGPEITPLEYVRSVYNPKAVETRQQEQFVEALDLYPLAGMAAKLTPVDGAHPSNPVWAPPGGAAEAAV